MKLSAIDTSVYYPITIPSNKQLTKFRPFRVREERTLLAAHESGESAVMIASLETVVRACVIDCPVDLTVFDLEFLFVHLRAKSIGEDSNIISHCRFCDEENTVLVDLTTARVVDTNQSMRITLSDKLIVQMKYASINEVSNIMNAKESQDVAAIAACIETIYYDDEVFHTKESQYGEIIEFILNRTDAEMEQITGFIHNTPTVVIESSYDCKKCGEKNLIKITDISDFF